MDRELEVSSVTPVFDEDEPPRQQQQQQQQEQLPSCIISNITSISCAVDEFDHLDDV